MLSENIVENVLFEAVTNGGDFAEVFVEDRKINRINMVAGHIDESLSGRDFGVGVRVFKGLNSVYGYTNNPSQENLVKLARDLASSLSRCEDIVVRDFNNKNVQNINKIKIFPSSMKKKDKIYLLKVGYEAAKRYDPLIIQVSGNYFDEEQDILVANTEGVFKKDRRVRTRYSIQSVAKKDGEMQVGYYGPGASMGFEFFEDLDVRQVGEEASRIAKTMVLADDCPSGRMPVIIHNSFGGVLFHEACGHGLEATAVAKGNSVFAGKLGQKVASELVTAVDDGTIPNAWGSLNIDDEGQDTRRNVLIENGILKSYLVDQLNSRRMDHPITGSGRRQSYKFQPTSRMNNTYILNGDSSFEDIISSVDYGLFAKKLGGGSVNPATGEFNFSVMEGYLVRNGKIDRPVRGAALIGRGIEVLEKIDMVGDNLEPGQGMCGSLSGSIPVNVGQPTVRVSELTVGGRGGES